jgi:hypothetical protein
MSDERDRLLTRAIRETLDTVVAPLVREALIKDALVLSGAPELPQDAREMCDFALGPLREVTQLALGTELADSVTDEIVRTLRQDPDAPPWSEPPGVIRSAPGRRPSGIPHRRSLSPVPAARRTSVPPSDGKHRTAMTQPFHPVVTPVPLGSRRRATPAGTPWPPGLHSHIRQNAATSPTDPAPSSDASRTARALAASATDAPALVLVATGDSALLGTLVEAFEDRGEVRAVTTPIGVVRHLDESRGRRTIVVVDGKRPSIRPAALAVLLEEAPRLQVVLCRAAIALEQVVLAASPAAARWLVYREPTPVDHVAAECVRLVS